MKFFYWIVIGVFSLFPFLASAQVELTRVKVSPSSLFTNQDKKVTITVQVENLDQPGSTLGLPQRLGLVRMKKSRISSGKKLVFLGWMNDSGVMGDQEKGDGIFTRKIQFKEYLAGRIELYAVHVALNSSVEEEFAGKHSIDELNVVRGKPIVLEIQRRPTFIETMAQVWSRIQTGFSSL